MVVESSVRITVAPQNGIRFVSFGEELQITTVFIPLPEIPQRRRLLNCTATAANFTQTCLFQQVQRGYGMEYVSRHPIM